MSIGQAEIDRLEAATTAFEQIITTEDDSVDVPNIGATPSLKHRLKSATSVGGFKEITSNDATLNLDLHTASVFKITLNNDNTHINIADFVSDADRAMQVQIILVQGTGVNKVTWSNNINWGSGSAPVPSFEINKADSYFFLGMGANPIWQGSMIGSWFNA